jgi:type I restriction enzyme S subunit
MKSKFKIQNLGNFIKEVSVRNNKKTVSEVFSVTNSEGFIKSTDYFDKEVFSKNISNYKIVKQNQFAYNPSRINIGSIDFLRNDFNVAISPLYVVFECKKDLRVDYLLRYLKSPVGNSQIRSKTRGAVRDNLTFKRLSEIEIPIPSILEQRKIAKLLIKIDDLHAKRVEGIKLLDNFLMSTFKKMFGDPIRNEKNFPTKRLGDLGKWKSGGTPSRSKKEYFTGDIPWLTSGELEEMYINDSKEKITSDAVSNSNARLIEEGSLLLGMYDTAALKSSITKGAVTCNQAIAYAKLNNKICNTIFVYFLIQIGKEYFKREQRGVRQQNMNLSMIKDMVIIQPPIKLQNQFSEIVSKALIVKAAHSKSLKEIERLYSSVSSSAFQGKLDLSNIELEHIVPRGEGGTEDNKNIDLTTKIVNRKTANRKGSILKIVVNKHFKTQPFSFIELAEKIQASLVEEEYDYNKIKNEVFASLNGNGDIKLKQLFNEKEKKILLQTDK